jgi:hypothetical protein
VSINQLYHTSLQQLRQLRPSELITRVRTFAALMAGIMQSKSVHLSHIALKIPARAKELSITRRKEAWLLATNLPTRRAALRAYRRKMWLDELFGDLKRQGFDLEHSHLRHFARLSRLTLAIVLLYAWLVTTAVRVIKRGLRQQVDRHERRDLSIFQIGLRWIERCMKNGQPFTMPFAPIEIKLSGS